MAELCGQSGNSLLAVDIGDPESPRKTAEASFNVDGRIRAITIDDGVAYVSFWVGFSDTVVNIYDISALPEMRLLGSLDISTDAMEAMGGRLYSARGRYGVEIYDVADPKQPELIGTVPTSGRVDDIALDEDHRVYVALGENGVEILTSEVTASQVILASRRVEGDISDVQVADGFVFVAQYPQRSTEAGMLLIDVTPPEQSAVVSKVIHQTGDPNRGLSVDDNWAYIVSWSDLGVIDIADPLAANEVGQVDLERGVYDVVLSEDGFHAYVVGKAGMEVVNVQTPSSPFVDSSMTIADADACEGIDIANNMAYVIGIRRQYDADLEMTIVDSTLYVISLDALNIVGQVKTIGEAHQVVVNEDHQAFVASDAGLQIIDVSDPADLEITSTVERGRVSPGPQTPELTRRRLPRDHTLSFQKENRRMQQGCVHLYEVIGQLEYYSLS